MTTKEIRPFSTLYWKISATFLLVLIIFSAIALIIFVRSAKNYSIEVNQKLNSDLASNSVEVIKPFLSEGEVNQEAIHDLLHSMMVINPSIEIYVLDIQGKILSYVAPNKVVKLEKVSLNPINEFLSDKKKKIIYGDDPRNPGKQKIFSAANVMMDNKLIGYVYIVLAGQEYTSVSQTILGSYILGLSIKSITIILILSSLIGLISLWFIIKRINAITIGIEKFQSGDLSARIPATGGGELNKISLVFNKMAEALEKNIEKIKGVDKLRRELIGNISHDLRTPVSAIQGYAETLILKKETLNSAEREKYLEIIYKSSEKLKKLVFDLFELSKLQSHQVTLHLEPFSVAELIHDIANKYRLISQRKGISINTIVSKNLPAVRADISLIDRIIQNLMDNAILFCNEGDTITIDVNPEDPAHIRVKISDTGEGIESKDLPYIFERYYTSNTNESSSGLGLAIVKKIIDLHQTTIDVQSIPGKGTSFYFSLPVAQIA